MKATTRFQLAIAALSALLIAPPTQSRVKAPDAADSHSIRPDAAVDESKYVRIGSIDQWIQISGTDAANPVLLWLNGGPGGSTVPDICLYRSWERAFTIVMWDQRGEGKTFERSGESVAASMTIDQMASDGIEVAEYLRHHLHKRKILLLGHSWGSILGIHMITRRPDVFAAYVGTGQVVNLRRQLEAGYPKLRERAAANPKANGELRAIGSPPWRDDDGYQTVNRWANTLDPPSKVSSDVCAAERQVPPPAYIQAGAQFSGRLLSEAIGREDLETFATHYALPVFFIQGRDDVLTTTSIVKEYVEKMAAPSKALIELPGSGHLAIFRDPDAFLAALESRVRPFAMSHPR
jgi:pimeloyl-ACP methyl ester carboxylesterase